MKVLASAVERWMSEQVWAINPAALGRMQNMIAQHRGGEIEVDVEAVAKAAPSPRSIGGGVAILPLYGAITHRADIFSWLFGGSSVQGFSDVLSQALADSSVSRLVIEIDSPGGTVDGIPELAQEILNARDRKPITAIANTQAASAAYWLGSQASEFMVTPSAEVGSIGVFAMHTDFSKALEQAGIKPTFIKAGKFKTEGNPYEPLSEEAKAAIQERVDDYYGMFIRAVAKGRSVTADKVRSDFGQGRVVGADDAVTRGMADKVATLQQAIGKRGQVVNDGSRAEADATEDTELRERRLRLARFA